MIETEDLVLEKAKFSDWKGMYENVWCHPEIAKYMNWKITTKESDAQIRIQKTIEFQKNHDTYLVYEKKSMQPIGFAGVEMLAPHVCQEAGICLGPAYVHKGYGKQILHHLIEYCKEKYKATEFFYSTREENVASKRLAQSFGFKLISSETKIDERNGKEYHLLKYSLKLS